MRAMLLCKLYYFPEWYRSCSLELRQLHDSISAIDSFHLEKESSCKHLVFLFIAATGCPDVDLEVLANADSTLDVSIANPTSVYNDELNQLLNFILRTIDWTDFATVHLLLRSEICTLSGIVRNTITECTEQPSLKDLPSGSYLSSGNVLVYGCAPLVLVTRTTLRLYMLALYFDLFIDSADVIR
ncbi:transcription factor Dp, invertebrate [Dorcoceras hygrometricum]|uniref:Transcription factor Dp, invertebrate n=1 Tax=Dorcoceras hygrometricum TaxID=472368 RepID=A0A2Z7CYC1_9LAMI|nr:transcription factor Dp, invertebrate [Dorcoceras hygrometricum]